MNFTVRTDRPLAVEDLRRWHADLFARNMRGPHTLLLTREQFYDLERSLLRDERWYFSPVYEPGGRYGRIYGFEVDVPDELRTDDRFRVQREGERPMLGQFQAQRVFEAVGRMFDPSFTAPRPRPRTLHSSWPA